MYVAGRWESGVCKTTIANSEPLTSRSRRSKHVRTLSGSSLLVDDTFMAEGH